ncbi:MAG: MarR family transcriptional regulator [Clostridiales bacterium]|nr:MarR family transcriptional regulator [Clostridiales bacterium]
MSNSVFDPLKLENQLCFPLYAASKEVIRRYKPFLDPLDLTYTQYITLMVLWDEKKMSVKDLGERLYLDSGTMTPVLKKLESKQYIRRSRAPQDERSVIITLTDEGMALKEKASQIPASMSGCIMLTRQEAEILHGLLSKILIGLENE